MSEKKASATSWLSADIIRNITFGLLLSAGIYGGYQLLRYGKRQAAYTQNTVLAQALDEYQKAQQGYLGSWETLKEIASTGAMEQSGTVVDPYLTMLQAQAQQHIQAAGEERVFGEETSSAEDLVYSAWLELDGKSDSIAVQDLLSISNALAGLDRAGKTESTDNVSNDVPEKTEEHIKTLESFFERLTDTQSSSEHYFDDYASYMLAYYWYSRGEVEKAQQIWSAIAATVHEGEEPSVWQKLSQNFIT